MWAVILGWTVVSIIAVALVGVGFSVMSMTPPEFFMAKMCFTLAAVIFFARVGFWLASGNSGAFERIGLTILICSAGGVCWVELVRWVDGRHPRQGKVDAPVSAGEIADEVAKRIPTAPPNLQVVLPLLLEQYLINRAKEDAGLTKRAKQVPTDGHQYGTARSLSFVQRTITPSHPEECAVLDSKRHSSDPTIAGNDQS
jgi:hypothetical protein